VTQASQAITKPIKLRTPMVLQLRPSRRALVLISQMYVYNPINYDPSTCSQRNIIYTIMGVCHISIDEMMSSPPQYIIPRPQ